jgi:hypothetical protein
VQRRLIDQEFGSMKVTSRAEAGLRRQSISEDIFSADEHG